METDNLIPLSYISQYNYCKRRAAILLLEQQWNESSDTAQGRYEHENVHTSLNAHRNETIIITDMTLISQKMQLFGKSDAIEAYKSELGTIFPFLNGEKWILYPIEYKHGRLRSEEEYELQLCAQAMCLEEKYKCTIDKGAIFFISSHRRHEVTFNDKKRLEVEKTASDLQNLLISGVVPLAEYSSKCYKCSLKDICLPEVNNSVKKYMSKIHKCFSGDYYEET